MGSQRGTVRKKSSRLDKDFLFANDWIPEIVLKRSFACLSSYCIISSYSRVERTLGEIFVITSVVSCNAIKETMVAVMYRI